MTTTDLPPRRALYFLNPTPPPVLSQAALDAMDKDPEVSARQHKVDA